jgi:RNA polymerase sigma-70 factor (ECF subfamily)
VGLTRNSTESLDPVESAAAQPRLTHDQGLIARASSGDRDAFAQLIETRTPLLLRTARAVLGNEADASDVTQESLTAAWKHLPRLRDVGRFDAWLHRVLMNHCRDHLRRRRRSRDVELTEKGIAVEDHATASVANAAVLAAFDRLRLGDRQILVLHHLHGIPLTELAQLLAIPEGTAKSRLHTARQNLQHALEAQA